MSLMFGSRASARTAPSRSAPGPGSELEARDAGLLSALQDQFLALAGLGSQVQTTWQKTPAEPIPGNFGGHVAGGLFSSGLVYSIEQKRVSVFSEIRFQWQRLSGSGGPADLFGDERLAVLENVGMLHARALLDADTAGSGYLVRPQGEEVIRLRPDWCDLVLEPRFLSAGAGGRQRQVGYRKVGLFYFEGGNRSEDPAVFLPDEFAHYAPMPDPLASYRGMSWLTPVLREIAGDKLATEHGISFLERGATPNMVIKLPRETTRRQFELFKSAYKQSSEGAENAYKTLLLTSGADVTPVGVNMKDLDMAALRGLSETRLAMAGGIHPVVLGSSEGMQGSSLNAGNYSAAKRSTADTTFRPLWRMYCQALEAIVPPPAGCRLWYDERDVAFLQEDLKDAAAISTNEASTIGALVREGFTPESVVAAVTASNWKLLEHTGLYSVQLQPSGSGNAPAVPGGGNDGNPA